MKNFLELIEKNPELKAKALELGKNADAKPADFIALAAQYGITLTEADFEAKPSEGELSDDEIDAVAGGAGCNCPGFGNGASDPGEGSKKCDCFLYGRGTTESGEVRCVCFAFGEGWDEEDL